MHQQPPTASDAGNIAQRSAEPSSWSADSSWRAESSLLLVVACGGGVGALARWGLDVVIGSESGGFPWSTFVVNVSGCLLIGTVMVLVTEQWQAPGWVRPLLGVGVLGGFSTFSSYAVEVGALAQAGQPALALTYWIGTVVCALIAVVVGAWGTRALVLPKKSRSMEGRV